MTLFDLNNISITFKNTMTIFIFIFIILKMYEYKEDVDLSYWIPFIFMLHNQTFYLGIILYIFNIIRKKTPEF